MPSFRGSDGILIAYDDEGQGPPVVLLHGYGANAAVNWIRPGVVSALTTTGYRVITPDLRGHGRSGAPHESAAYTADRLVEDVVGLLDEAGPGGVVLGGYSLGARLAMLVAGEDGRIRALVLGGVGAGTLQGVAPEAAERVAAAMEAPRTGDVMGRSARAFRSFADATGSDRVALAALQRALPSWPLPNPAGIAVPSIVLAGADDTLAGDPGPLAKRMASGEALTVPGNHMNAMLSPEFRGALVGFLDRLAPW